MKNKRAAAIFIVAATTGACGTKSTAADTSSGSDDAGSDASITSPAIWLQSSPAIDPTKLPLCTNCYTSVNGGQPKKGYVFVCDVNAYQQVNGPGGMGGPWVNAAGGTYDFTKKPVFQGNVYWPNAQVSFTVNGDMRAIAGNGLPVGVPTGTFPVSSSDPAYAYDHNPNAISAQTISFSIPKSPTIDAKGPHCTYKRVGITLDGIQLHGPLDSMGRDELAYQLQDVCTGDAQPGGGYHRHSLGECTPHIHENNALVGYALDGFGIFSPYDANGKELASADLDECHGTTSEIAWDGQTVNMYHYVLTRDFPYTPTCFRGVPVRNAFPALPGAPPEQQY
jgi:hypothetical protein